MDIYLLSVNNISTNYNEVTEEVKHPQCVKLAQRVSGRAEDRKDLSPLARCALCT